MTYDKLFFLKYKKGLSTFELIQRYPKSAKQVSRVALCDVPEETLKEIISEEEDFARLMALKKKFKKMIR